MCRGNGLVGEISVGGGMTKGLLEKLQRLFGRENVYYEQEDMLVYGYDSTPGIQGYPEVVVFPTRHELVQQAVMIAAEEQMPVIPRGSGTGLSGGCVAVNGGMVLGLSRLNAIREIDEENLTVTCDAGVVTLDLYNAVAARGLFYPPDPGSQKISTIGGNIAENAGGLRGLKYGVTRDYVMGLQGVLSDGQNFATGGKAVKDVAGYSLRDLLVGSEGTLGIITSATLQLIPPPQDKRTMLAYFRDVGSAAEAVSEIIAAKVIPATLEIMDNTTINCVEDFSAIGLPRDMAALLLIEVDGHPAVVEEEAEAVMAILRKLRASETHQAKDVVQAEQLTAARRTALSALARVSPTTVLEDATVPRSRLANTFAEIERLKQQYSLAVGTFGHAGDGNLHPTCLADEGDCEQMSRVHAFFDDLYNMVLDIGGTVSGEHGIGLAKQDYLRRQIGDGGIKVMRQIKDSFDPVGRLNPGKIFVE